MTLHESGQMNSLTLNSLMVQDNTAGGYITLQTTAPTMDVGFYLNHGATPNSYSYIGLGGASNSVALYRTNLYFLSKTQ